MSHRETPRNPWPVGVAVLGLVAVAALAVTVVYGIRHASRVSDPRYYVRGLEHDARMKARARAAEAGWTAAVAVRNGRMTAAVTDRDGTPLAGARVRVVLLGADGLPARTEKAVEGPPGTYSADLPPPGPNPTARLEVERDGTRLIQPLLLVR